MDEKITHYKTYSFNAFIDLKVFFEQIENSYINNNYKILPPSIRKFITAENYTLKINEINSNTKTLETYIHRFFFVFDAFWILKSVHFYRDNIQENNSLFNETKELLTVLDIQNKNTISNKELLKIYRDLDRK